jgi:hypothetical protein
MAGLDPAVHEPRDKKAWMPGASPAMTVESVVMPSRDNLLTSCP